MSHIDVHIDLITYRHFRLYIGLLLISAKMSLSLICPYVGVPYDCSSIFRLSFQIFKYFIWLYSYSGSSI
jgi:hypothetical protein